MAAATSVLIYGWDRREDTHFFRWFYDETASKERFDGPNRFLGEWYFTESIIDTKAHREMTVVHQEDLVMCFNRNSNVSIPHPTFDAARYVGKTEIDYVLCDHWVISANGRDVFQIYDDSSSQEILRLDYDDPRRGHAVVFRFYEWDASPQDPSLWVLSPDILAICTPVRK